MTFTSIKFGMQILSIAFILEHLSHSSKKGILALDLGLKKIGIAYVEYGIDIAIPLEVINLDKNGNLFAKKLADIIEQMSISLLVIGITDDKSMKTYKPIIKLIKTIADSKDIKITFEDESYTTSIANEMLKSYGLKRKKRNKIDDMVAAKLILESFLNKL